MITIVFQSFHSEAHIKRLVAGIEKKYPIIVIENSSNKTLKEELEKMSRPRKNTKFIVIGRMMNL